MQLSIVIPTHRSDLVACSRILQACSWAGPNLEVIVRDNSGNARKRNILTQIKHDHCNIIIAEPCGAAENYSEGFRQAKGEFLYVIADDDLGFDRGMTALPGLIEQHVNDPSVAGISGNYAIEQANGSALAAYQNLDSSDVTARVAGYLAHHSVNVLYYSPVRRELYLRVFEFIKSLPFFFSFHDQISCLLYLLNGRFVQLKRLMYLYDAGAWQSAETAQKIDLNFLSGSNLDPATNRLHWFICGFEGAVLIRNFDGIPDYPLAQRQAMADRWFSTMFVRFLNDPRQTLESPFAGEAEKLYQKWKVSAGRLSFHDMVGDIANFIALFSKSNAEKYFGFWDALLSKGGVVGRERRVAAG